MTDDPLRLLDAGALTPDERRALEVGATERSPVGAKAAIWGALTLKLMGPATAAAATASTSTLTTAASSAAGAGGATAGLVTTVALVKSASIGLVLGAAVGTGLYFGGHANFGSVPAAPRALVFEGATAVTAPFHARASAPNAGTPSDSASASPPAPSAGVNEARGDGARAERMRPAPLGPSESQRVARARSLLHAGDAPRALEVLGALARDAPNGLLAQEREALTIEALASLGRRDDARARAAAFLARYPASPHAVAVRRAAGYTP